MRVEHLADGDRRHGVLADQPERVLVLGRRRILEPEQPVGLDRLAEARRLDRRQAVVDVVQQVEVEAELRAHGLEELRREVEVLLGRPRLLLRPVLGRRLVRGVALGDAVDRLQSRHAALRADRLVAQRAVALDRVERLGDVAARSRGRRPARRRATRRPAAGRAACPASLALDVPQRHVDRGDRRHRHRAAPPVRALVEVLPDVLDALRVAADQQRAEVVGEVARRRRARGR